LIWGTGTKNEDISSLKSIILLGIRGLAAYAHHAAILGKESDEVYEFIVRAFAVLADENATQDALLPLVLETGKVNLTAMELLDAANTGTFGHPAPVNVGMKVAAGPFIVVSGHDLHDLHLLLEQSACQGVDVYTHGEMLPAHAYPGLNKFPHLRGHFGTAWQNQQKEFDALPGAILFTTNCVMPPRPSYADRVFTTGVAGFPGTRHIEHRCTGSLDVPSGNKRDVCFPSKDFSAVIAKAKELGGFPDDRQFAGINGGTMLTTGFARNAVLSNAPAIIEAVKSGAIKHFYLVGGCDGAKPGRGWFTDFVKSTPPDTVILTLACGKFRFNDLDLGKIGPFPRILDIGQCNDAYSAIQIASALAGAFGCGINDLPLSFVLSWYEQKAVAILLTLFHLGVKNIRLGSSLPAFVTPAVLDFLVQNFGIAPVK